MAKKKRAKGRKRRIGRIHKLPKTAGGYVKSALRSVRLAKIPVERAGGRAAWRELHHIESRLSRLA